MPLQDNESCVLLHKNCPFSTRKWSKHMHVRCLFVVDNINKNEVKTLCYPIKKMIVDYSTKPIQGSLFESQRNVMLGIKKEDFGMHKVWHKRAS